ncbi:MAG: YraN family protein [Rickettsiales bacterium]|jgi:putative endonuclease|nr:YraN family protein [Rickettsiales bacterium]
MVCLDTRVEEKKIGSYNNALKIYKLGLWGEAFLMFLLFLKGHKIVARRYKTKSGEIDLIAIKGNELVVYEEKSSRSMVPTSEIVRYRQKYRIENALRVFLSRNNKYIDYNISYCIFFYKNMFTYKFYK